MPSVIEVPNTTLQIGNIVKISISNFPIVNESIPLENIIQFRNENRNKLLSLRKWIYEVTRKGMNAKEASVEIQYLMEEYKKAMSLYEMKYTRGKIETIITASLDIIENLAKFKPSNIMNPFFSIKRQKMDLLEAELKTPGREIAYIVKAQEEFGKE
jgi:hypothetical protein